MSKEPSGRATRTVDTRGLWVMVPLEDIEELKKLGESWTLVPEGYYLPTRSPTDLL